jgi:hypothetical protein
VQHYLIVDRRDRSSFKHLNRVNRKLIKSESIAGKWMRCSLRSFAQEKGLSWTTGSSQKQENNRTDRGDRCLSPLPSSLLSRPQTHRKNVEQAQNAAPGAEARSHQDLITAIAFCFGSHHPSRYHQLLRFLCLYLYLKCSSLFSKDAVYFASRKGIVIFHV